VLVQARHESHQSGFAAEYPRGLRWAAELRERVEGELLHQELRPFAPVVIGIGTNLLAHHAQPGLLAGVQIRPAKEPRLKARAQFGGALLTGLGEHHVSVLIDRDPLAGGRVDVVIDVQRQQPTRFVLLAGLLGDDDPAFGVIVIVAVVVGDAHEVEHRKHRLALGLAGATAAHLLVQDA